MRAVTVFSVITASVSTNVDKDHRRGAKTEVPYAKSVQRDTKSNFNLQITPPPSHFAGTVIPTCHHQRGLQFVVVQ